MRTIGSPPYIRWASSPQIQPNVRLSERIIAEAKRNAKKSGVLLGMSPEQVIGSSWGKPRSINRTTGSYGTHEQWVYGGAYLYFQNGGLKSIQH